MAAPRQTVMRLLPDGSVAEYVWTSQIAQYDEKMYQYAFYAARGGGWVRDNGVLVMKNAFNDTVWASTGEKWSTCDSFSAGSLPPAVSNNTACYCNCPSGTINVWRNNAGQGQSCSQEGTTTPAPSDELQCLNLGTFTLFSKTHDPRQGEPAVIGVSSDLVPGAPLSLELYEDIAADVTGFQLETLPMATKFSQYLAWSDMVLATHQLRIVGWGGLCVGLKGAAAVEGTPVVAVACDDNDATQAWAIVGMANEILMWQLNTTFDWPHCISAASSAPNAGSLLETRCAMFFNQQDLGQSVGSAGSGGGAVKEAELNSLRRSALEKKATAGANMDPMPLEPVDSVLGVLKDPPVWTYDPSEVDLAVADHEDDMDA
ncbi:hypothetical protein HYH03_009510 [Edaphochlamys debaryana]|uniref:Uncharacterized protein n=1 Tax=Edaphochlamys debaryana TaxID=47281 RepID=A0A835XYJ0_9CHLO|nr:hypothetical protein HYH03_009510 [Edaphochlamys debaryana]|eukprot:KAG2492270.1 hypothetical protein HYH03_009510 [Edaphochlamys debaryana]